MKLLFSNQNTINNTSSHPLEPWLLLDFLIDNWQSATQVYKSILVETLNVIKDHSHRFNVGCYYKKSYYIFSDQYA